MSKHFLFCIPVRFGVFIMSLSMLLLALVGGAASIFLLQFVLRGEKSEWFQDIEIPVGYKVTLGLMAGVNVLVAIFSPFGFIGAIIRKRGFVKAYSSLLWFSWGANLGISIAVSVALAMNSTRAKLQGICDKIPDEVADDNPDAIQDCKDWIANFNRPRTLVPYIIFTVLSLLWHLYGCIIVGRYVKQLEEEQAFKRDGGSSRSGPKSFYPHDPVAQQSEPLTTPAASYAYSDPHHAFGGKNA
jgi:hypothetical protein